MVSSFASPEPLDLVNPTRTVNIGVVLVKGATELLDVAILEFFVWTDPASLQILNFPPDLVAAGLDVKLHWVTEDGGPAPLRSGAKMLPTGSFTSSPPLDIAIVGAHHHSYTLSAGERAYLTHTYETCSAMLSVCDGIETVIEALPPDTLAGKKACAPRGLLPLMRKINPKLDWQGTRWTRDGRLWSASTLMSGGDLIRGFVESVWGPGTTRGEMMRRVLDMGNWPDRDRNFKDFEGTVYEIEFDPENM